jgi:hypothetical protein
MKKVFAPLAAALIMSATVAMAAAPAAPIFSMSPGFAKVADGHFRATNSKMVATDGTKFYIGLTHGYTDLYDGFSIASSTNGGLTWQGLRTIYANNPGESGYAISVALNKTILSSVWAKNDPATNSAALYYSWANTSDLSTWSPALQISGASGPLDGGNSVAMATSSTGAISIMYTGSGGLFYTSATSNTGYFPEPAVIASDAENDYFDFTIDKSNNIHAVYTFNDGTGKFGVKYRKMLAGSNTWTTPVILSPANTLVSDWASITSYDANNIYVATNTPDGALSVFSTSNGGTTWIKSKVDVTSPGDPSIAVSASKVIAVGGGYNNATTGNREARVYKSTDAKTWSAPTVLTNHSNAYVGFDASGKMAVATRSEGNLVRLGDEAIYFFKEK